MYFQPGVSAVGISLHILPWSPYVFHRGQWIVVKKRDIYLFVYLFSLSFRPQPVWLGLETRLGLGTFFRAVICDGTFTRLQHRKCALTERAAWCVVVFRDKRLCSRPAFTHQSSVQTQVWTAMIKPTMFSGLPELGISNGEDLKETLTNCTEPLKAIDQFQVTFSWFAHQPELLTTKPCFLKRVVLNSW